MKAKKFRKTTFGKGMKRTQSKNMTGIKLQPSEIKKEILGKRSKQSKLISQIKDDIKKMRENNISISGLEQISASSIKKMQEKRQNSILHLTSTVSELNILIKKITRLETKYQQAIH